MTDTANLVCIGEVLVEMVADQLGQSAAEAGHWIGPFASGAPAIFADQAALCGANVSMIGCVGADGFGEACLTKLRADGVDVSRVAEDPGRSTGVAFVRYREDGSRSFIYHIADSASGRIDAAGLDGALDGADCLHLMGSSAFSDHAVEVMLALLRTANAQGVKVSFDPNVRKELLTDEAFARALREILDGATYVLASEGELEALLGAGIEADLAAGLLEQRAEIVVVKRGNKGSSLYLPGGVCQKVLPVPVQEVDPTGAGDCFGGTFVSLVLQGEQPENALRLANLAGALSVTQRGPMSGNRPLRDLQDRYEELADSN